MRSRADVQTLLEGIDEGLIADPEHAVDAPLPQGGVSDHDLGLGIAVVIRQPAMDFCAIGAANGRGIAFRRAIHGLSGGNLGERGLAESECPSALSADSVRGQITRGIQKILSSKIAT
jgi:hypothetical protein